MAGTQRIDGHKGYPNGPGGSSSQFSQKGTRTNRTDAWTGHADADGKETIPLWRCEQGCPAGILTMANARYFPQFTTSGEVLDWLRRLIQVPEVQAQQ